MRGTHLSGAAFEPYPTQPSITAGRSSHNQPQGGRQETKPTCAIVDITCGLDAPLQLHSGRFVAQPRSLALLPLHRASPLRLRVPLRLRCAAALLARTLSSRPRATFCARANPLGELPTAGTTDPSKSTRAQPLTTMSLCMNRLSEERYVFPLSACNKTPEADPLPQKQTVASRPPLRLLRKARPQRLGRHGPEEVGSRRPREGEDDLGRRAVQAGGYLSRWCVHTSPFPLSTTPPPPLASRPPPEKKRNPQLTRPHRVPNQAPKVQIHPPALPPKRLPLGHRLPLHPQRRRGLEARHHHQGDPARHPVAARRAESRVPCPGRRVQPVQEGPPGVREEGEEHRQGEPRAVEGRN